MLANHSALRTVLRNVRRPIEPSFLNSATDAANAANYSFASATLGTPAVDRIIVVGIWTNGASANVTSATIAGVTATFVAQANGGGNTAFAYALVPDGTSGTIAFNQNNTTNRAGIGWWRITNASLTPYATATDSGDTTPSPTLDVVAGGALFAISCGDSASSGSITGVTENFDTQIEANSVMIGGHLYYPSFTLNQAVNFTFSGAAAACASAISFRPA
jgi:hypothetical protein